MPPLVRVLVDYDLGLLKVMADLWGVELPTSQHRAAAEHLAEHMLQPAAVRDMADLLTPPARAAMNALYQAQHIPWATFQRAHGDLRAMGPGRRERERPWLNAPSVTEQLWYRGLVARGFLVSEAGVTQEYAFIPNDLRQHWPPPAPEPAPPPGHPISETWPPPRLGLAVADVTTLLAYWQVTAVKLSQGVWPARHATALHRFLHQPAALTFYTHLAEALGLITVPEGQPVRLEAATARRWLEEDTPQAWTLAQAWRDSASWNDLRHLPGLLFEGEWRNDPVLARAAVLRHLTQVPVGVPWALDSFVAAMHQRDPDFQRPGGDYETWYIREAASPQFLRGVAHWPRIEGALIRWLITTPLVWLGAVTVNADHTAFALTPLGTALAHATPWVSPPPAEAPWHIAPDGLLTVPLAAPAYARFQLARVTNWVEPTATHWRYRLAPAALKRALRQNIGVAAVIAFLQRQLQADLPPNLLTALHRWERAGSEASVRERIVLQVSQPAVLESLRREPSLRDKLGEPLSDTLITVHADSVDEVRAWLAALGLLTD